VKELLGFPKFKSNEALKEYLSELSCIQSSVIVPLDCEKLIEKIKTIEMKEISLNLSLLTNSLKECQEGLKDIQQMKNIAQDYSEMSEILRK
jgi:hypothetical protein